MCGFAHIFQAHRQLPPSVISLLLAPTRSCVPRRTLHAFRVMCRRYTTLHVYMQTKTYAQAVKTPSKHCVRL